MSLASRLRDVVKDDQPSAVDFPCSVGEVFHILGEQRRRWTIEYLYQMDCEKTDVADLADTLVVREVDGVIGAKDRKAVYVSLYQSHLPRMHQAGLIEFGPNSLSVEVTCDLEPFVRLMELAEP